MMRHRRIQSIDHENQLYDRARNLSKILHVPFPELLFRVDKIDKDGIRKRVVDRHSRSLVRNWYNRFYCIFTGWSDASGVYGDGTLRCKQISGAQISIIGSMNTAQSVEAVSGFMTIAGEDNRSIQIGIGTVAESFDDYVLATHIVGGEAVDQMRYGALAFTEGWNAGGPYYYAEFERVFDNVSGGGITVEESSVLWYRSVSSMAARDYFGGGIAVAHGEGIAINYEFRMTFP